MKKADNFDASKWLVENKITTQSRLKEEKTWDDVDKELADEEAQDMENARVFINTTPGKNAVRVIKALISKPYGYDKLDKVLQVLNLDRQNFIYAAKAAGMDFETDAAGIHIYDNNYQDQDVAINQINGEWIVG
jgi:hypothetical protein